MISIEVAISFFLVATLLGVTPGPDNLFVLMQSASQGRKAGLVVTLGLCTGLIVHTLAVALGVAVIFKTSTLAFTILKIVGALYLLYLAIQAFKASAVVSRSSTKTTPGYRRLYGRGFIMNITNPKISIFFLAFLPQFADATRGSLELQMMSLGALFIASTLLVFGTIAFLSGTLGARFAESAAIQRGLNRVAGVVFIGLAVKLALSSR